MKVSTRTVGNKVLENKLICKKCWAEVKTSKLFILCRTVNYINKTYMVDMQCSEGHQYSEVTPYVTENIPEQIGSQEDNRDSARPD